MPGASEPAQIPALPMLQYWHISVAKTFIIWVSTAFFMGGYPNVHVHSNLIIVNILPTLKEKSGAETAPPWSRFHVHRMAPI